MKNSYNKPSVVLFKVKIIIPGAGDHSVRVTEVPADTSDKQNMNHILEYSDSNLELRGHWVINTWGRDFVFTILPGSIA